MDKRLVSAFIFGLLAVTVANLLLSVGIVSLLLTRDQGTSNQLADSGTFPGLGSTVSNSLAMTGMNNSTTAGGTGMTAANATNVTKVMNVTATPTPSASQDFPAGMPSGGQFTPPSGGSPPSGQMPSGTGQAPTSGQSSTSGQTPSGTGQTTSATGLNQSGTTSLPASTTSGTIPVDVNSLMSGLSSSKATATPRPTSVFGNFSSLWNK